MTHPVLPPSSKEPNYFILFIKILLVIIIILLLPQLVQTRASTLAQRRRRKFTSTFQSHFKSCSLDSPCSQIPWSERFMCVTLCIHPSCHETIYGMDPLEKGEVDENRERAFEKCVKEHHYFEEVESKRRPRKL